MASLNKVQLIGNVGADPEIKSLASSGDRVANFTVATSESWKDKNSGEKQERTQWHKVAVFNQNIVGVIEKYVKKGSKIYIEGQIETRSWEKDGVKHYATEIVIKPFNGQIVLLSSSGGGNDASTSSAASSSQTSSTGSKPEVEDEIPFNRHQDFLGFY